MDPASRARSGPSRRFPRTRGDGPVRAARSSAAPPFPPHSRGWTHHGIQAVTRLPVSPALAGMDLASDSAFGTPRRFPRTRGDGPANGLTLRQLAQFPPHSRGWTLRPELRDRWGRVSPALAGMDPLRATPGPDRRRFPRTRGDGPDLAGGGRGVGAFPPHSRGWTESRQHLAALHLVSPALAGMDLRGDDVNPEMCRFPRTRGDGPIRAEALLFRLAFPPHSRGWTPPSRRPGSPANVSPALAGMDPRYRRSSGAAPCFPRTRGDGPVMGRTLPGCSPFPPHSRGWTPRTGSFGASAPVSPALAGMDPSSP